MSTIDPPGEAPPAAWRGYAFMGDKAVLIARRLAYIEKHGARFLFDNTPPPVPGYPRNRNWRLLLPKGGDA